MDPSRGPIPDQTSFHHRRTGLDNDGEDQSLDNALKRNEAWGRGQAVENRRADKSRQEECQDIDDRLTSNSRKSAAALVALMLLAFGDAVFFVVRGLALHAMRHRGLGQPHLRFRQRERPAAAAPARP